MSQAQPQVGCEDAAKAIDLIPEAHGTLGSFEHEIHTFMAIDCYSQGTLKSKRPASVDRVKTEKPAVVAVRSLTRSNPKQPTVFDNFKAEQLAAVSLCGLDKFKTEQPAGVDLCGLDKAKSEPQPSLQKISTSSSYSHQLVPAELLTRKSLANDDPYETIRKLEHGGNGACFLVRKNSEQFLRVCKVISIKPDDKGVMLREERIHDLLPPHRNIVGFYEASSVDLQNHLYLEYCSLGDLCDLIGSRLKIDRHFKEGFVWHAFRQLSAAVAFIHEGFDVTLHEFWDFSDGTTWQNIIHGDIKPKNVFLRPSQDSIFPDLVLGDFGNAKFRPGKKIIGTPRWGPPEIPEYSPKADVWGVGALVYAMCGNGDPPVAPLPNAYSYNFSNVKWWHCQPRARVRNPLGPEYSSRLDEYLNFALAFDPIERSSSFTLCALVDEEVARRGERQRALIRSRCEGGMTEDTGTALKKAKDEQEKIDQDSRWSAIRPDHAAVLRATTMEG